MVVSGDCLSGFGGGHRIVVVVSMVVMVGYSSCVECDGLEMALVVVILVVLIMVVLVMSMLVCDQVVCHLFIKNFSDVFKCTDGSCILLEENVTVEYNNIKGMV